MVRRPGVILPQRPLRPRRQLNLSKLDLETEAGLQESAKKLIAEVQALRRELAAARERNMRPKARSQKGQKEPLPGAVPTDPRLLGMLRQFIQKTNTDDDVDRVLAQMKTHADDSSDLLQQACDGLTRVISVNYGTPHAQKAGRAFIVHHSKK